MTLKILVIGGSGVFGGRLVNGILATSTLEIVIAGRHSGRCRDFIATHDAADQARLSVAIIDTGRVTAADLLATGAAVVADTTGPFQGHDFRLARAAIEAGIHYVDLADARDFVGNIAVLDQAARSAGVAILSGASSTPSLSNAVLDALVTGWQQVDHVRVVISPGNRTPRGLAVVRSILSYAGRPVRVFLGGTWRSVPGWGLTRRLRTISLGRRWVALCETPDLDIIPARFRVQRSAVFQAGLELGILHLGLLAASLLVRMRVLRSLAPFATIVRALATLFERAGTDRGVMLVEAAGLDRHGRCARAAWTLIADAGDGLNVPTIPALVVVRALAAGRLTWRGAGPCVGIVPLEDLEVEFLRFRHHHPTDGFPTRRPGPLPIRPRPALRPPPAGSAGRARTGMGHDPERTSSGPRPVQPSGRRRRPRTRLSARRRQRAVARRHRRRRHRRAVDPRLRWPQFRQPPDERCGIGSYHRAVRTGLVRRRPIGHRDPAAVGCRRLAARLAKTTPLPHAHRLGRGNERRPRQLLLRCNRATPTRARSGGPLRRIIVRPCRLATQTDRSVIRVSSDGRPRRMAKPGHMPVPLLT